MDWTFTYPNGGKSTELRVVEGDTFQMVMESSDVLHSFYIPRFRVKQDVVPGRFTSVWFRPSQPTVGDQRYHLFCTEYCGTNHPRCGPTSWSTPRSSGPSSTPGSRA